MSEVQKLLFICGMNQRRSVTAERLFRGASRYEVKSAGTEPGARVRVTLEQLEWADLIFVMEDTQVRHLQKNFKSALRGKRLICLQLPDKYGCMSLELMDALEKRLSVYLAVPGKTR